MVLDESVLEDMKQEAEELWARMKAAEEAAEKTQESQRAKELLSSWAAANRRLEAATQLLNHWTSTQPTS